MLVALLALFVALTGAGYAATQLPNNSVGTPQLKNNAVTSAKVANGTLVKADFKSGQLTPGPAGPAGPAGPKGDTGPAGPPGTGTTLAFATAVGDSPTTTTSATLSTVGSASLTVPTGQTATVIATFSAESVCRNGVSCTLRLFIDDTEMNPEDGTNFWFDSPSSSASPNFADYEAHSITRIRVGVAAGAHTISAQIQSNGGSTFRVDDWSLVAVAYKQA
jgi:hypothetical protein